MSASATRRALIVDCSGLIKRYHFFYTPNKPTYYAFDRFCDVLIESITRTRPSIIYTTSSPPIDRLWRRQLYPNYQSNFSSNSPHHRTYSLNAKPLDELQQHLKIINHIECPLQQNESGDIIASIIHQYTTKHDEIYVLAQSKKFEQLLSLNDASGHNRRNIYCMKSIKKEEDIDDDEANFTLKITQQNQFGLTNNALIIDYLSLIGIQSHCIGGVPGIGPIRAKKLLEFGGVPFLLNDDIWKTSYPTQGKWIEDNAKDLELFYEKLIPFERYVQLDKNVMDNASTIEDEFYEENDDLSLLRSMKPLAIKYNLKNLLWRMRKHSVDDDYGQKVVVGN